MTEGKAPQSILGPVLAATLTTSALEACIDAWCTHLHQQVHSAEEIDDETARNWHRTSLAGARQVWLANQLGEPWLRLIEDPDARPLNPFDHSGWLSLEINVESVDTLHESLEKSPLQIIGEPRDLDISPDIRAMQVIGPAGEVCYLTEIKRPVPGFDLPLARCPVDKIFIPVLLGEDRARSLATYEQFPGTRGQLFDTRITVINGARKLPLETRHPIATLQLAGQSLIEIDQLEQLRNRPRGGTGLASGISAISFAIANLESIPDDCLAYAPESGPFSGKDCFLLEGNDGELIELVHG